MRRALEFLRAGGLLVVFPAGEVAHFQWKNRTVCDPPWPDKVGRLIRLAHRATPDLVVLPAFVDGRNSAVFQWAGLVHPRLRTALLLRELLKQQGGRPQVRLGRKISAGHMLAAHSDTEAIAYLRWRVDLLGNRPEFAARTAWPIRRRTRDLLPISAAQDAQKIALELARLPILATAGLSMPMPPTRPKFRWPFPRSPGCGK